MELFNLNLNKQVSLDGVFDNFLEVFDNKCKFEVETFDEIA